MKKMSLIIGLGLCLSLLVTGCGNKASVADKAQLVKTQTISLADNGEAGTYAGNVRGRYETNLAFQVGGQILARNVQVGDRVKAGDVLMVINAKDVVQQANQGDAQVSSAKAQLALAEANLARYRELYNEEAVAAAVLDQYQTNYDAAQAAYESAVAQSVQGHNALGYTNLVANADGVVAAVQAEAGQVVAAGQSVLTLVQSGELEVEINVPENHIKDMPLGKETAVSFWALSDTPVTGIVREVAPMADAAARTYKVRVSLPEPPEGLELGMTASVAVAAAASHDEAGGQVAILPLSAIYQTDDTPQVWVVDEDMTLHLKDVSVDDFGKDAVKATGLDDGDIVVTAGVHKLHEGQEARLGDAS
jgi:RND family efflux transporter MFP subunit